MNVSDLRRFLAAFLAMLVLCAAGAAALLWSANLLNQRRLMLDRAQLLPARLDYAGDWAARWFANTAAVSPATTWLVGSSISQRGFDVCDFGGVANFSRPAQTLAEAARWLPAALAANPGVDRLLMELSFGVDAAAPAGVAPGWQLNDATSGPLLFESTTALLSTAMGARDRRCVPEKLHRWPDGDPKLEPVDRAAMRAQLTWLLARLEPWCHDRRGHQLVLFVTPWFPDIAAMPAVAPRLAAFHADAGRVAAAVAPLSSCRVRFAEMRDSLPPDRDEWFNYRHFGPPVGRRMLRALVPPG